MNSMNANIPQPKPFTAMLAAYEHAAALLEERSAELRTELRELLTHKDGTRASANREANLARRIVLLREEREDLQDAIRRIRPYAEMEAQS